ncbi:MAG TPA: hypothetical protein VGW39_03745 [Chthoniobacterales bacterium]|nr:hypothetical protein [Chthoniobacterales bacterium]
MGKEHEKNPHFTRHPFFLLLIGASITSILIPAVIHCVTQRNMADLARRTKAVEVLKQANLINQRLNLIQTAIENFEHDVLPYSFSLSPDCPDEFKSEQKELRKQIESLYADFNTSAWFVFRDLSAEASILHVLPADRVREFNKLIDEYNINLAATTANLRAPWFEFVRARRWQGDWPQVDMKANRAESDKLRDARTLIAHQMARLFN